MLRKLSKKSHDIPLSLEDRQSAFCCTPDLWLCRLPSEILEIIFNYLSPQTLVKIRELGVERLTEVSLTMKVADFSQWNTVLVNDLSSFFTEYGVEHIKEINFDNVFFIRPATLEKCIAKCKHLRILSVIECGISYTNILCILKNCSELEELYWSLCIKKYSVTYEEPSESVKKLYLHIKVLGKCEVAVINKLLEMCPNAHDVCFNISPYFSKTLPLEIKRTMSTGNIFFKNREHPVKFVTFNELSNFPDDAQFLMERLSACNEKEVQDVFNTGEDLSFFISNFSSYLQFITDEKDMAKLYSVPDASIHSLIVIMNDQKAQLLNHIEKIKQVTGSKLKHLTLCDTSVSSSSIQGNRMLQSSDGALMCDILSQIVCNSMNLSVLNLSEMHFDNPFPFPALFCLRGLKVFSISSCSMKDFTLGCRNEICDDQVKGFEGFVNSCVNVEKFFFLVCLKCWSGPNDTALSPIHKWKKLKSLSLVGVKTFRICPFLGYVARNCLDLQNLQLVDIGDSAVCHYLPHVIQIIRNSKKLRILRINQPMFYVPHSLFWKSIEFATNLQVICLATMYKGFIENKIITDALRKLPFLHVFHLGAPRACESLSVQVKQIFTKHEVQTHNVHVYQMSPSLYKACNYVHFPTF